MRLLCIEDGVNDFGTDCNVVKKGQVYTACGLQLVESHRLNYTGYWYELKETPGFYHYSGLFEVLGYQFNNENIHKI